MFRFTTRDLLWLMVVVGLSAGWSLERRNADSRLINAVKCVAGDWAREVDHPVKYRFILSGGGTFSGVMGP